MAAGKQLVIPWLLHFAILVAVVAALLFFAPYLLPLLPRPFATFAAVSTALFPLCRRRWAFFAANYLVSAAIAVALVFV